MKNFLLTLIRFIGSILLIVGGVLAVISIIGESLITYKGSQWIEVTTQITYTYSTQVYNGRTNSGLEFAPHPIYSFIATDGKTYNGSTYSIPFGTTKNLNFLVGATTTPVTVIGSIFYNPNNPYQSAVERPESILGFLSLLFVIPALAFIVAGYFLLQDMWKKIHVKSWHRT